MQNLVPVEKTELWIRSVVKQPGWIKHLIGLNKTIATTSNKTIANVLHSHGSLLILLTVMTGWLFIYTARVLAGVNYLRFIK